MKKSVLYPLSILFAGGALFSCELKDQTTASEAVEVAEEYSLVNKLYNDASNTSDDGVMTAEEDMEGSSTKRIAGEGPTITVSPADLTTFPKNITIDFGQEGITGEDGVLRQGIVMIESSDWHSVEGSVHTTTFSNYYQNGYKVEGTHVSTNLGNVDADNQKFQVVIEDGKVTTPAGEIINYEQNTTRTQKAGASTKLNVWDDEYLIEGTQSGISSSQIEYSMETKEALHFVVVPRGIVAGILELNIGTIEDIEIDYAKKQITTADGNTYPLGN